MGGNVMAIVNKRLCKGTLTNSVATLYTVPAATITLVKAITICNLTGYLHNFTIVFAGTTVVQTHNILGFNTLTIPFLDQILNEGELIQGLCNVSGDISYYISGKEVA
jgi:hypothetical protein